MSVLHNLKSKVVNVKQSISQSVKSLTQGPRNKSEPEQVYIHSKITDAGADLLSRYQDHWKHIHENSEACAKKAETADAALLGLLSYIDKQHAALVTFHEQVSALPDLLKDVEAAVTKTVSMEAICKDIERLLLGLEDLCEEKEHKLNKEQHFAQLFFYEEKKKKELEKAKVHRAALHREKIEQYEASLQELLLERQKAFESTYKEELENYRTLGQTYLKPSAHSPDKTVDLGDINLDDGDSSVLDAFLGVEDIRAPDKQTSTIDEPLVDKKEEELDNGSDNEDCRDEATTKQAAFEGEGISVATMDQASSQLSSEVSLVKNSESSPPSEECPEKMVEPRYDQLETSSLSSELEASKSSGPGNDPGNDSC